MIHRQTLHDSLVLMKDTEAIRGLPLMKTNEMWFDSVVFTKDTGVIGGLPIDDDQRKTEKNGTDQYLDSSLNTIKL